MTTYHTSSGSRYEVRAGRWRKNNDPWERVWWLKALTPDAGQEVNSWEDVENLSEDRSPDVGEHLYIGSRDVWWLSTEIVGVEGD